MTNADSKRPLVVVLGAGVAGLTAAHLLSEKSGHLVHVIDCFADVGGNHRSSEINGFTFDMGCIVFWKNNPFFQLFPSALALTKPVRFGMQRLTPAGIVSNYPFSTEKDLLRRGALYTSRIVLDMLMARFRFREPANAEEYALRYMGRRLYRDSGLGNYLDRFYGIEGSAVAVSFAQQRMGWIAGLASASNLRNQALSLLRRRDRQKAATGSRVFQPYEVTVRPQSGFPTLYREAMSSLSERGVTFSLSTRLDGIHRAASGFILACGGSELRADRVVSTLPLEMTLELLGQSPALAPTTLPLTILLVSFKGKRGFDAPVLYNFHDQGRWKRLTLHSDYYGERAGREYLNVEITGRPDETLDVEGAFRNFTAHVQGVGLFVGDLRLEGTHHSRFGYPIYTQDCIDRKSRAMALIQSMGIETTGRQGAYEYLPNSGLVAEKVRDDLSAKVATTIAPGP